MYLYNITKDNIYLSKVIPTFSEDNEARLFIRLIFDHFEQTKKQFSNVRRFFHLVDANIGSENLKNIFKDTYLLQSTMKSICILDGDQNPELENYIITLPGGDSPEKFIMDYSISLYNNNDDFWRDPTILNLNYVKVYYRDNILPDINNIESIIQELKKEQKSTKGKRRELNKKVFIKHQQFFELLFKHWINNNKNTKDVNSFYENLHKMFKKVSTFHGINPNEWDIPIK